MFPNKNWRLGGLKALIKKLTTQVLCGQCEVNHYPICRTTVPVLSVFLISAFKQGDVFSEHSVECRAVTLPRRETR